MKTNNSPKSNNIFSQSESTLDFDLLVIGWQLAAGRGTVTSYNVYQCKICGKSYIWKSSYNRHVREECGGNRGPATCKNCGRQYRWRDSLVKHLKYECGVEPRYACSMCGRKFRHKQVLTSHFKRIHK